MGSDLNRRDFLIAAGTAGITSLAGCNTAGNDGDQKGTNSDKESTKDTSNPTYDIRTSALEYDLTDLATEETNTHNQAYVQNNHSAQLGVTVLENGEEVSLENLSNVHLENEEGEEVETTDGGYVPEYAVNDGQELTVRAEVNGETLEDTITVTKELPGEYIVDAAMMEDGETVYETDWNTPYEFDTQIVNRQAFLDQRAERRNELAADKIISEADQEISEENMDDLKQDYEGEELVERILGSINAATRGIGPYGGSSASPNSFNVEKAMLDHFDYSPVIVGGFVNPAEPDVPDAGDGDGMPVDTQIAFVDGDWYENSETNVRATHIDDIDESPLVGTTGANFGAVSVLAEFERGNTELLSYDDANQIVEETVTSPVALNRNITELDLSDDISWNTLDAIRDNTEWEEVMVPMELATAVGTDVDGKVEMEGENTMDSRIRVNR